MDYERVSHKVRNESAQGDILNIIYYIILKYQKMYIYIYIFKLLFIE